MARAAGRDEERAAAAPGQGRRAVAGRSRSRPPGQWRFPQRPARARPAGFPGPADRAGGRTGHAARPSRAMHRSGWPAGRACRVAGHTAAGCRGERARGSAAARWHRNGGRRSGPPRGRRRPRTGGSRPGWPGSGNARHGPGHRRSDGCCRWRSRCAGALAGPLSVLAGRRPAPRRRRARARGNGPGCRAGRCRWRPGRRGASAPGA